MRFITLPLCAVLIGLSGCGSTTYVGARVPDPTGVATATVSVQAARQKESVVSDPPFATPEEQQPTPVSSSPTTAPAITPSQPLPSASAPVPASPMPEATSGAPQMRRATQVPVQVTQPAPDATANPQAPSSLDPQSAALVQSVQADLAQRQVVAIDAVEVVEVRSVTWPDPGLGCPQPGMVYKQVPVDGLLIRLRIGETIFNYHSGGGKAPFLCEQPQKPRPSPASGGENQ